MASMPPVNLTVPREQANQKLTAQIQKGSELRDRTITSKGDLEKAIPEKSMWSDYNIDLLTRQFDNDSIAKQYPRFDLPSVGGLELEPLLVHFRRSVDKEINYLQSLVERLDLFPEPIINKIPATLDAPNERLSLSRNIFIVHGHDEAAREAAARFIEKLGFHPVILHEKPNAGRTLIEKFEHNADAAFAIVLLTPDDIGYPKDKPDEARPRARQNVIFELGYFIGKLKRAKVCALYKGNVEILSDYQGVLYIQMDSGGAWRLLLAKEIKEAGLDVDLNKAL